jgi:hypothetical protein
LSEKFRATGGSSGPYPGHADSIQDVYDR